MGSFLEADEFFDGWGTCQLDFDRPQRPVGLEQQVDFVSVAGAFADTEPSLCQARLHKVGSYFKTLQRMGGHKRSTGQIHEGTFQEDQETSAPEAPRRIARLSCVRLGSG